MAQSVGIRVATLDDIALIAEHRAKLLQELGRLPGEAFHQLQQATATFLQMALPTSEYLGWLAYSATQPNRVVAGAGVQRRQALPHPTNLAGGRVSIAAGRHAIVLNVYTEPDWRRQGVATRLMQAILDWARHEHLDRLVLHASGAGRPLYERLGFVATNEMRFNL